MKWESLRKFLTIEVKYWNGDNAEQLVDSLAQQIRYHDRTELKKERDASNSKTNWVKRFG